jgi:hypothetical protein
MTKGRYKYDIHTKTTTKVGKKAQLDLQVEVDIGVKQRLVDILAAFVSIGQAFLAVRQAHVGLGDMQHYGAVQCSAVQCSAVQCSAVQCSAVQCSAVQ